MLKELGALVAHNLNQQQAMQRAAQAQAQGLSPEEYGTVFPGSTVTTTNNTTTNNGNGGWLKGALVSAAMLAGGGTGAAVLMSTRTPEPAVSPAQATPATPTKPPAPKVITLPGKDQQYDAIYEVQQPDGSWKQVKRERLKPKE